MKLEAMNGNLMSLPVKVPPAEELLLEMESSVVLGAGCAGPGGGCGEGEQQQQPEDEGEGDKEVGGVGKKKGTRKKRSLNWEEAERCLLVEVIKAKVEFVENRNVDAKSIKAKRLAWMQITKQFNALNFRHRSLEQIQVQWRSMKNSAKREYQQKNPKAGPLESMDMIDFIEEMQKDPSTRSQTRGNCIVVKKELLDMDDENTPLAALPTATNTSEDTLQTSTIALPSPPPSAESQYDTPQQGTPTRNKKKNASGAAAKVPLSQSTTCPVSNTSKQKRQRSQNSTHSDSAVDTNSIAVETQPSNSSLVTLTHTPSPTASIPPTDDKYKKQLFELMKRARLADIEYARKEHEQKLRFEQMTHDLKLSYYRQQEEQKLRLLREEHEVRLRQYQAEHEARMRVYTLNMRNYNAQMKTEQQHKTDASSCN